MSTSPATVDSGSHWYDWSGNPRHDATLREARKENLLPSVTTVLGIQSAPFLETWKLNQAILSAITLPRRRGETDDEFAARVVEDSRAQSKKAAEFGTYLHDCIEKWVTKGVVTEDPRINTQLHDFMGWWNSNVEEFLGAEFVITHPLGYAGRVDLYAIVKGFGPCVLDVKTQNVKGGKANYYDKFLPQLVAYGKAIEHDGKNVEGYASLVIDSNENGTIYPKMWEDAAKWDRAWEKFKACLQLWKIEKNYNPGKMAS